VKLGGTFARDGGRHCNNAIRNAESCTALVTGDDFLALDNTLISLAHYYFNGFSLSRKSYISFVPRANNV
jgi:hypothetical protein